MKSQMTILKLILLFMFTFSFMFEQSKAGNGVVCNSNNGTGGGGTCGAGGSGDGGGDKDPCKDVPAEEQFCCKNKNDPKCKDCPCEDKAAGLCNDTSSIINYTEGSLIQSIPISYNTSRDCIVSASGFLNFYSPDLIPAGAQMIDEHWSLTLTQYLWDNGKEGELVHIREDSRQDIYLQETAGGSVYRIKGRAFPVLEKQADNSFTLTTKKGDVSSFTAINETKAVSVLSKVTNRNGLEINYTYNVDGNLTEVADSYGAKMFFAYNASKKLSKITTFDGFEFNLNYTEVNGEQKLTEVILPTGKKYQFTYQLNTAGTRVELTEKTRPDNSVVKYSYTEDGFIAGVIDGNNNSESMERFPDMPSAGLTKIVVTDKRGNSREYHTLSDSLKRWIKRIDPLGRIVERQLDTKYRVISQTDPCGCGSGNTFAYDTVGNRIMEGDNLGNQEWFVYNANNDVITYTDKAGNLTSYEYDTNRNRTATNKPLGVKEIKKYNSEGRVTEIENALGEKTIYQYSAIGDLIQKTSPTGAITTYTYNELGRKITERNGDNFLTKFYYNYKGEKTKTVGPVGDLNSDGNINDADIQIAENAGNYEEDTLNFIGKVLTHRDRSGNVTTYEYDNQGNRVKVIYPDNSYIRTWYDEVGNPVKERDQNGNYTFSEYDKANQLTRKYEDNGTTLGEIDAGDAYTEFTYNERGQIIFKRDKLGNITERIYDDGGRLIKEIDAAGGFYLVEYDVNGNTTKRIDKEGKQTTFEYDACNRLIKVTDHDGNFTTNTYNTANRLVSVTDKRGIVTYYTYDAEGRVLTETADYGAGRSNIVTAYTYDNRGNRLSAIRDYGGANQTTFYVYDEGSKLVSATAPTRVKSFYTYDNNGNTLSKTIKSSDGLSAIVTSYTYNNMNRVTSVTNPDGTVTAYTYDSKGNKLTETKDVSGLAIVTKYEYNCCGRLMKAIQDYGTGFKNATTTFTYDLNGNRLTTKDPTNKTTVFEYDTVNRLIKTTDPMGYFTQTVYNKVGNVIEKIDANSRSTFTVYDNLHRVIKTINEMNQAVEYTYDSAGNRLTLKDANNNVSTWTYNAFNQPVSLVYPNGNTESYVYNRLGQQTAKTTPSGVTIGYVYNTAGQLTSVTKPDGNVSYTYNTFGQQSQMTSPGGNITNTYDSVGRLASTLDSNTGKSVSYTYNSLSLRASMTAQGQAAISYGYDRLLQLTAVQKGTDSPTTYAYDLAGRRIALNQPNGVNTAYQHDSAGRLTGLTTTKGASTYAQFLYTLDNTGNRTAITQSLNGVLNQINYTFDNAYRLTGEIRKDAGNNVIYSESFVYDNVGNRISQVKNGVTTARTYNNANQLISEVTGAVTKTYTYDNNGNNLGFTATDGSSNTMVYDSLNRMTSWTDGTNTETNSYRGAQWHRSSTTASGKTTNYLYDGDNVIVDYFTGINSGQGKAKGKGKSQGQGQGQGISGSRFYVTPFLDQNVSMTDVGSGQTYYYSSDGLGSVRTLTDSAGVVQNAYDYTGFGETFAGGTVVNVEQRYAYTGREKTSSPELMYYRWRMYGLSFGRFVGRDPIGYDGGIGLYVYVGNRVNIAIDPFGDKLWGTSESCTDWYIFGYTRVLSGTWTVVTGSETNWDHVITQNLPDPNPTPYSAVAGYRYSGEQEFFSKERKRKRINRDRQNLARVCVRKICGIPRGMPWVETKDGDIVYREEEQTQFKIKVKTTIKIEKWNIEKQKWELVSDIPKKHVTSWQ